MMPETAACVRAVAGIAAVTVLESVAMATGHNGTVLRLAIAAVAGLGGFAVGQIFERHRRKE